MRGSLLREREALGGYVMVLRFGDVDQAAAWSASARHQLLSPELKSLHEGSEVTIFEVVLE
jgi:antibiotic biosynthesis monooxygenase (ABM) superfamily enzyme